MKRILTFTVSLAAAIATAMPAKGQTSFTYQGELKENDCLADGTFDMEFTLWNSSTAGSQIGVTNTITDVEVSLGRFSVVLNMGSGAFDGGSRWLEITVEGDTLSPRQRITSTPYAIHTRGIWVNSNLDVGIGTSSPEVRLDVAGDAKVSRQLGVGDPDLLFGQLTVVDSGEGVPFAIDAEWNHDSFPTIFASNAGEGGALWAQSDSDASPAGGGIIVAGDPAGENIAIDANEIMARDGTNVSALHLNHDGGDVVVGGTLDIGWQYECVNVPSEIGGVGSLLCPEGKVPLGGGCASAAGLDAVESSGPFCDEDGCGWDCIIDNDEDVHICVICARVK